MDIRSSDDIFIGTSWRNQLSQSKISPTKGFMYMNGLRYSFALTSLEGAAIIMGCLGSSNLIALVSGGITI
jgi:hypothetical protein